MRIAFNIIVILDKLERLSDSQAIVIRTIETITYDKLCKNYDCKIWV